MGAVAIDRTPPDARVTARYSAGALFVIAVSAAVFWRTAYPSITWWDSSRYSLAASTLGVSSPPGSLILTLLGWPLAHLPFVASPAHAQNLLAGLLAALTTALVYVIALELLRSTGGGGHVRLGAAAVLGAALGALTLAFSATLWEYATQFTPYILTTVFTGLILWTMLRWWEEADAPGSWRWLALLGLLFGLDFSVHRTNAVLLPAALAWILMRKPQALRTRQAWLGGVGGLAAGLTVQLLNIPLAIFSRSPLQFDHPSDLTSFWNYISLRNLGGSFLLNVFPRKSALWSQQTGDFLRVMGANDLHWSGATSVLGVLPAIAAVIGLVVLCKRNRRLGIAFALVVLLQAVTTVLYFNIPSGFFRSLDRHYLPVCVMVAVLIAYGLGALLDAASRQPRLAGSVVAAMALLVPGAQFANNWSAHDESRNYFTIDYATNALESLPPRAIYITVGDNDTFPVMYLQSVEKVRPDVRIINIGMITVPAFVERLRRIDPSFPVSQARNQPLDSVTAHIASVMENGTAAERVARASRGASVLDSAVLNIMATNGWRDPLCFAISFSESTPWLEQFGRLDGLYTQVMPAAGLPPDAHILRAGLIDGRQYRGFADSSIPISDVTHNFAGIYYGALTKLLDAEHASGANDACRKDAAWILSTIPPERLALPAGFRTKVEAACGA